jgi:hypothetical protein
MNFIKNLIYKLIGKKVGDETNEMTVPSKTKLTAVIAVILAAIPPISLAWGHPIEIPDYVYKILGAAGLWTMRDAIK